MKTAVLSHTLVKAKARHYGMLLKLRLIQHASGRPGPRTRTGEYIKHFWVDFVGTNQYQARIRAGNTEPYSDRLEWGFTGFDKLGRYYDQPPFPHFRPAIAEIMGEYEEALGDAVTQAIVAGS
jgi:hypothetical protein